MISRFLRYQFNFFKLKDVKKIKEKVRQEENNGCQKTVQKKDIKKKKITKRNSSKAAAKGK